MVLESGTSACRNFASMSAWFIGRVSLMVEQFTSFRKFFVA
jgi:hypothetical protein